MSTWFITKVAGTSEQCRYRAVSVNSTEPVAVPFGKKINLVPSLHCRQNLISNRTGG